MVFFHNGAALDEGRNYQNQHQRSVLLFHNSAVRSERFLRYSAVSEKWESYSAVSEKLESYNAASEKWEAHESIPRF